MFGDVPHPVQIALALLGNVRDEQRVALRGVDRRVLEQLREGEQRGQAGAVVGNTRSTHRPVGLDSNVFRPGRSEDRVHVRRYGDIGQLLRVDERHHDVPGGIDPRLMP